MYNFSIAQLIELWPIGVKIIFFLLPLKNFSDNHNHVSVFVD